MREMSHLSLMRSYLPLICLWIAYPGIISHLGSSNTMQVHAARTSHPLPCKLNVGNISVIVIKERTTAVRGVDQGKKEGQIASA